MPPHLPSAIVSHEQSADRTNWLPQYNRHFSALPLAIWTVAGIVSTTAYRHIWYILQYAAHVTHAKLLTYTVNLAVHQSSSRAQLTAYCIKWYATICPNHQLQRMFPTTGNRKMINSIRISSARHSFWNSLPWWAYLKNYLSCTAWTVAWDSKQYTTVREKRQS